MPQFCICYMFHEPECRNFRLKRCHWIVWIWLFKTLFHRRFEVIHLRKYLFLNGTVTVESNATHCFIIALNMRCWILLNGVIPISTSLCIHILRSLFRTFYALIRLLRSPSPWRLFIIKSSVRTLSALQIIKASTTRACRRTLSAPLHRLGEGFRLRHVAIVVHHLLVFFVYAIFKPFFIVFHRTNLEHAKNI